ncbi:3818_t:CDS:1 [Paraglomus occultum]|uniref:3818_t:CDS:1 n=1 Tax=Paraglomus occultum TaxID=144539 RepID=A0A9N9B0K0_9GLOM|nr:3818_t:CDS:1 [Paraglomus occultum]
MDALNNVDNDYVRPVTNAYQSSYLGNFDFGDANSPLIHQSHTPNFLLSVSNDVDGMFTNTVNYDYASYQDNPSVPHFYPDNSTAVNGQLRSPNFDQAETHADSSCPLPVPCQTFCESYSDVTNDNPTDNYFQRLGASTTSDSSVSYILTQEPTNFGYVFMKVEYTQLGRIAAADVDKILALLKCEK